MIEEEAAKRHAQRPHAPYVIGGIGIAALSAIALGRFAYAIGCIIAAVLLYPKLKREDEERRNGTR